MLIFANLPAEFFHTPALAASLLDTLHVYGALQSYTPLPAFGRAIVVYRDVAGARHAKSKMDLLLLPFEDDEMEDEGEAGAGSTSGRGAGGAQYTQRGAGAASASMRVYYGPPHSEIFQGDHSTSAPLPVPSTDRNFLISPPGSPPVGWEPVVEDPPNRDTLADDLIRALGALRDSGGNVKAYSPQQPQQEVEGEEKRGGRASPTANDATQEKRASRPAGLVPPAPAPAPAVIIPPTGQSLNSVPIPAVSLESFDGPDSEGEGDGGPVITSGGVKYQGFSITSVKATVESMRANRSRSGSNASLLSVDGNGAQAAPRISPTARPPLAP